MSKKLTLIITAAVLAAMIVVGGTLAYYTSSVTSVNVVTMGNIKIELAGTFQNDFSTMPGMTVPHSVQVKNIGVNPAYVRLDIEKLWLDGTNVATDKNTNYILLNLENSGDWTLAADGYYYYNKVLAAGAATSFLYQSITVDPKADNAYIGLTGKIIAKAEAVQSGTFTPATDSNGVITSWQGIVIGA